MLYSIIGLVWLIKSLWAKSNFLIRKAYHFWKGWNLNVGVEKSSSLTRNFYPLIGWRVSKWTQRTLGGKTSSSIGRTNSIFYEFISPKIKRHTNRINPWCFTNRRFSHQKLKPGSASIRQVQRELRRKVWDWKHLAKYVESLITKWKWWFVQRGSYLVTKGQTSSENNWLSTHR